MIGSFSTCLSHDTGSDSAIGFVLEKYKVCCENHTRCKPLKQLTTFNFPLRLLDVGTERDCAIVLRSTSSFRDEEYVCLSHCRGEVKTFTLNAQTQSVLSDGLDLQRLPKTFQDPVLLTRRLHIRYLWIDSL